MTEYDNLYVCDCSVIPEAWGLPPTLTLIGLGKRLAKHLSEEKKDSKDRDAEESTELYMKFKNLTAFQSGEV